MNVLYVAAGGAAGALTRYAIYYLVQMTGYSSPFATLAVNLIGCFAIGLAFPFFTTLQAEQRLLLVTGFLGSFTTFSTFALDTASIPDSLHSSLYLIFSVAGGVIAVFSGMTAGRFFTE